MKKLQNYWKELQRRHVVKAGIAYLVASWLVIQVLSILLPLFEIGNAVNQMAVIILAIGFPVWLVIAWVYDFSPNGIKKTEAATYDPEIHKKKNIGLNRFIIGGLSIAVILLVFNTFRMSTKIERIDAIYQKALATNFTSSIAVLALENLSPDNSEDFFAKGLSREIQQHLTKLKEVKVVSTNSTFEYKGQDINIEVIGKELNVSYLLAGNVIKIENTYRANIELISTQNGEIIWSKQFDGNIENILDTYDDITRDVAAYLKATFNEEDIRSRKVDPEAYVLYLKAFDTLHYFREGPVLTADSLIRQSIALDPNYAPSQATLSMTTLHKGIYLGHYTKKGAIRMGKSAALKALELDPTFPEGYTWLSNWNWHEQDVQASMRHLDSALKYAPDISDIMYYASFQSLRTNQIDKALQFSIKAVELDPNNRDGHMGKAFEMIKLGMIDEAKESLFRFYQLDKHNDGNIGIEAWYYKLKGEFNKALQIVENEPDRYWYLYYKEQILASMGNLTKADELLKELMEYPNDSIPVNGHKPFDLVITYANRGDHDRAFEQLDLSYGNNVTYLEWFFLQPEFETLYDDPRWNAYIDRLREEFNYEFPYQPE